MFLYTIEQYYTASFSIRKNKNKIIFRLLIKLHNDVYVVPPQIKNIIIDKYFNVVYPN